jgi:hypothetical protein
MNYLVTAPSPTRLSYLFVRPNGKGAQARWLNFTGLVLRYLSRYDITIAHHPSDLDPPVWTGRRWEPYKPHFFAGNLLVDLADAKPVIISEAWDR